MLYEKFVSLEDRSELPLNGPSNYRISDGKIITRAIEINAVRQCNLSCRSCSHSSPISKSQNYQLNILNENLLSISKFLKCEFVRVVGGEPLLYPNLLELLKTIKNSGICDKICLVTNGILLNKISDEMLQYIDKIEISYYPLSSKILKLIREGAIDLSKKNVKVRLLEYSDFRESIAQFETQNNDLIQTIYDTCQIAHNWRCITIDNNRIYRCPQSMINDEKTNDYSDSLYINDINNINELLEFLENNNYLSSCSRCLGSVGKKISHTQISKELWERALPTTPEEGIDREYAKKLVKTLDFKSDCLKRSKVN